MLSVQDCFIQSEFANLELSILRQSEVRRPQVTMDYITLMHEPQGIADLAKPLDNVLLWEVFSLLPFDGLLEAATLTKLHDHAKIASRCGKYVIAG